MNIVRRGKSWMPMLLDAYQRGHRDGLQSALEEVLSSESLVEAATRLRMQPKPTPEMLCWVDEYADKQF